MRECRRAITAEVRELIEAGVAVGAFTTSDPGMSATALLSLGIDIARSYHDEGTWSPEAVGDFYAVLAGRMLGTPSR